MYVHLLIVHYRSKFFKKIQELKISSNLTDSYVTRNKDDLFSDKYLFDTPCILPINLDHTNPDQVKLRDILLSYHDGQMILNSYENQNALNGKLRNKLIIHLNKV
ncbi:Uncharacterized protein FWK35_00035073 [Aphis craccivora]|uniref:Uncharacterized protein n=1 Tax=Aphis craccivora TaxID=307492 RepID=A0A6G0VR52_APHCR|nr:Uncharacterized protein FWK35_00035073 [Aphis craccivora]